MTSDSQTELRLVLLGRPGAGKTSAVNIILGHQAFLSQSTSDATVTQGSEKYRGWVAGKQVAMVDSPDCFCSERPPEDVRCHVSSCVALSTPGPHAFLLCVPVDQPADTELRALEAMERVFGPTAVSGHTIILFTHTDKLEEGQKLEEHIATGRKDLLELVEKCGDRYHALKWLREGGGEEEEEEEQKSVEELLEKVEQTVKESGTEFYSCPLYQEAEERVRERQKEIARQRREGSGGGEEIPGEETDPSVSKPEQEINDDHEEEMEEAREEAERSVNDLNVDGCITSLSLSSPPPSFLWSLWEKVTGWLRRLPKMVRREALLGAFVGLFVGGPFGGMLGATVGSVATEVGRRKTLKTEKNK